MINQLFGNLLRLSNLALAHPGEQAGVSLEHGFDMGRHGQRREHHVRLRHHLGRARRHLERGELGALGLVNVENCRHIVTKNINKSSQVIRINNFTPFSEDSLLEPLQHFRGQ